MDCVLFVSLIIFVYVNSGVIVGEYILVGIFFLGHNGGSYLAQAHAVSPSGTSERELLRDAILFPGGIHHESRAIKVGRGEVDGSLTLCHDLDLIGADDPEPFDAPQCSFYRFEGENEAVVCLALPDESRAPLGIRHLPAVKSAVSWS